MNCQVAMTTDNTMIGQRVKIEYDDQNEKFAFLLPCRGTIIRQLRAEQGVVDWFLIKLDIPFDYQIKSPDSFSFTLLHCDNILIRSRWKGHRIGDVKPTSVFILLIRDKNQLQNEPIKVEQFYHAAWGMCHTEQILESSNI